MKISDNIGGLIESFGSKHEEKMCANMRKDLMN